MITTKRGSTDRVKVFQLYLLLHTIYISNLYSKPAMDKYLACMLMDQMITIIYKIVFTKVNSVMLFGKRADSDQTQTQT